MTNINLFRNRPVAVIDESDLLVAITGDPKQFSNPVRSAMKPAPADR